MARKKAVPTANGPIVVAAPEFHERLSRCLDGINKLFVPPFNGDSGAQLVKVIKHEIRCDAVSIFIAKQDPSRADYIAGIGYKPSFTSMKYYLKDNAQYLTSHVFKNRSALSGTHEEIERKAYIQVRERSAFYIETDRATNIIAVPIMACRDRCYGVLNFENKEDALTENGRFPEADFIFARVLANLLGVAFQQRLYGKIAVGGDNQDEVARKTLSGHLQDICQMLKRHVRAECVSVFLKKRRDDVELLAYEAGVGYIPGYHSEYRWDDKKSFTVHVARGDEPLLYTEEELMKLKNQNPLFAFTGQCVQWISSGTFRNVLGIPIRDDGNPLGVLKLENKLPEGEKFNDCDAGYCLDFVRGPIRNLLLRSGSMASAQTSTRGYRLLVEHIGPASANGARGRSYIEAVRTLQERMSEEISGADCAAYLGISRATYYREIRERSKSPRSVGQTNR